MNDLSIHAYQGHPRVSQVFISNIDVTDLVDSVDKIDRRLDYPELNKWISGECVITMIDPDGDFSSGNANNFFVRNGQLQDGRLTKIEIKTGYNVDGNDVVNTLFVGEISKTGQGAGEGTTEITATDTMSELFDTPLEDFGVDRHFRIELERNQGVRGVYPIIDFASPISKGSVEVKKNASEDFTQIDQIAETGVYNKENFVVEDKRILSEYIEFPDTPAGYPQFVGKSAFYDRGVEHIVDDILTHIGVTNKEVSFSVETVDLNISRNERIGYRVVGNPNHSEPFNELISWKGYPTYKLVDGDDYYVLYNSPPTQDITTRYNSYLMKYNKPTDTWSVLLRRKAGLWGLAKEGTKIAIACTDDVLEEATEADFFVPDQPLKPVAGSYDCTEGTNQSYILLLDEADSTVFTLVPKTSTLPLQIGQRYILGATPYQRVGEGYRVQKVPDVLPDTVRNMAMFSGTLYYFYAQNHPLKFHGLAKIQVLSGQAPTQMFRIITDGINHLGGNLIVNSGGVIYLGTARKGGKSRIFIVGVSL